MQSNDSDSDSEAGQTPNIVLTKVEDEEVFCAGCGAIIDWIVGLRLSDLEGLEGPFYCDNCESEPESVDFEIDEVEFVLTSVEVGGESTDILVENTDYTGSRRNSAELSRLVELCEGLNLKDRGSPTNDQDKQ